MTYPDPSPGGAGPAGPMAENAAHADASARPPVPRKVVCPVCSATFKPRATGGKCPVCGEQVVPQDQITSGIPTVDQVIKWLTEGGWRLVALIAFVLYQAITFGVLWKHLADIHAFN